MCIRDRAPIPRPEIIMTFASRFFSSTLSPCGASSVGRGSKTVDSLGWDMISLAPTGRSLVQAEGVRDKAASLVRSGVLRRRVGRRPRSTRRGLVLALPLLGRAGASSRVLRPFRAAAACYCPKNRPRIEASVVTAFFGASRHEQRSFSGTPPRTCSTCMPHPANVGFLHSAHSTFRHMALVSLTGALLPSCP